ncbi:GlxA family transcriptional regulator [Nocardia bovistercoris]|uniref:GlxA family transcriptional regulator n=1 Tax=Nocardia bovistercoris TaxID=2785916 RepID=A0A931N3E6_9NOCA|nr:GlxA family transcriptional regulator [Nocardia bovistercoris]MBH0776483.1 GlxA family transcriptional regulator [Nocardia bovistercoris]
METRTRGEVVVAVADGVLMLDVAGPAQVWHWAGRRVRFASPDGRPARTDIGAPLGVDCALAEVDSKIDTLVVPGYPPEEMVSPPLVRAVRELARNARRIASVCTGAFVLAEAGLLDGRRATTHWMACAELAQRFPSVSVEPDAIYVRDGDVITSAGVTAGIDMALALVEADDGQEAALDIARHLVVFLRRPGGQSQFSVRESVRTARTGVVRTVLDAVAADPSADHSLAAMAERGSVSGRHLTRLFRRQTGLSPARYVEQIRVEAAKALLVSGDDGVATVARRCGFGSEESMRRSFVKLLGVAPTEYRGRFRANAG